MADITIQAEIRNEFGKNVNRRLRSKGRIPGIIYGKGTGSVAVSVDPKDVHRILQSESGHNTIFKLDVDGSAKDVLIREYQLDPVLDKLLHADFQAIAMDEIRVFEVPVEALGVPKGVKEVGGVLDIVMRQIELECLPRDVPDRLRVQVSHLEIGDSIRVQELQVDTSKVKILSDPELVVLTVVPPQIEKEPEVAVEEAVAEPEVIKKGKVEGEEEAEAREE